MKMMHDHNLSPNGDGSAAYRAWLRGLVSPLAPTSHSPSLFKIAWEIKYLPTVPNDQNRYQDGMDLRPRYVQESSNGLPVLGECTMLEFLIGLAIRLNNADYDPAMPDRVGPWFWALLDNLGIIEASDVWIETAFFKINTRDYSFDGFGGLFPIRNPKEDQRNVEVWYQMQAYLMESRH